MVNTAPAPPTSGSTKIQHSFATLLHARVVQVLAAAPVARELRSLRLVLCSLDASFWSSGLLAVLPALRELRLAADAAEVDAPRLLRLCRDARRPVTVRVELLGAGDAANAGANPAQRIVDAVRAACGRHVVVEAVDAHQVVVELGGSGAGAWALPAVALPPPPPLPVLVVSSVPVQVADVPCPASLLAAPFEGGAAALPQRRRLALPQQHRAQPLLVEAIAL